MRSNPSFTLKNVPERTPLNKRSGCVRMNADPMSATKVPTTNA
jgi:hypothetical protein